VFEIVGSCRSLWAIAFGTAALMLRTKPMLVFALRVSIGYRGKDCAADKLGDLWDYGVSEGSQSVHP
jgi:hypothetical protein